MGIWNECCDNNIRILQTHFPSFCYARCCTKIYTFLHFIGYKTMRNSAPSSHLQVLKSPIFNPCQPLLLSSLIIIWCLTFVCFLMLFVESAMQLASIELRRSLSRCEMCTCAAVPPAQPRPNDHRRWSKTSGNLGAKPGQERGLPAAGSRGEAAQRGACACCCCKHGLNFLKRN